MDIMVDALIDKETIGGQVQLIKCTNELIASSWTSWSML